MKHNRKALAAASTVAGLVFLAGCAGGSTGAISPPADVAASPDSPSSVDSAAVLHGTQSGPGSYLSSGGAQVVFVRFTDAGEEYVAGLMDITNSDADAGIGTHTAEYSFSGARAGSSLTMTVAGLGSPTWTGTLNDDTLSLNIPQTSGQLATQSFAQATIDEYNAAVADLQNAGHAQAQADAQARAEQARQASNAKDEQTLQDAVTSLRQDADFSDELASLADAVTNTDEDLAQTRADARDGQGEDCYNVSGVVGYDAESIVGYDAESIVGYDIESTIGPAIKTARQDIQDLNSAADQLRADGLAVPTSVASATSSARAAITKAIATTNHDIDRTNADVVAAYAVANGLATGPCAGEGPGKPPKGLAHLR